MSPAHTAPPPLVFITGASSGIGEALARHYVQRGWRVALVARRDAPLQALAAELRLANPGAANQAQVKAQGQAHVLGIAADVQDADAMVAAAHHCIKTLGLPDVVIANAGISVGVDTAERGDIDVLRETFAINNVGMAATFHPFVAAMRARGSGTLVGVASVAAIRGLPGHGAYCASKAGVVAYCESLRGELRGTGVKVTTLLPGYIATPLTEGNTYPMPFLMPATTFAAKAAGAIVAQTSYRVIPWQMGLVTKLLRLLPNAVFDRVLAGRGRKKRRVP
jgi:short-subunit dehydrogenase